MWERRFTTTDWARLASWKMKPEPTVVFIFSLPLWPECVCACVRMCLRARVCMSCSIPDSHCYHWTLTVSMSLSKWVQSSCVCEWVLASSVSVRSLCVSLSPAFEFFRSGKRQIIKLLAHTPHSCIQRHILLRATEYGLSWGIHLR